MGKKYFVIGVGGTGMRCIESMIHLCAMGMFGDTDIHLLAMDTDKENGNFQRLRDLKNAYIRAKGRTESDASEQAAISEDSFFTAKLNYYEFSPEYSQTGHEDFRHIYKYNDTENEDKLKTDLADLLFSEKVETFDLHEGYRAQTHLGSLMMYHSIIEEAGKDRKGGLKHFIEALNTASSQSGANTEDGKTRLFILGSVFGGTGASSIPVIPQALAEASLIIGGSKTDILSNVYFGSTLLTAYFSFNAPGLDQLTKEKVIAQSDSFALNSKVAMMFYEDDLTVMNTYQRFYLMGTPTNEYKPYTKEPSKVEIGRAGQKNDSHYIELLAACAALDFFHADKEKLEEAARNNRAQYLFRSIDESGKLDFKDFTEDGTVSQNFAKRIGLFTVFAILNNGLAQFTEHLQSGKQGIEGYADLDVAQLKALREYFTLYFFERKSDGTLSNGWLKQLYRSAGMGDRFLLHSALFQPQNEAQLSKLRWNETLYKEDGIAQDHAFTAKKLFINIDPFDPFKDAFKKEPNSSAITNKGEQLYKRIYDTLVNLYKFK